MQPPAGKIIGDNFLQHHDNAHIECSQAANHGDTVEHEPTTDRNFDGVCLIVQCPRTGLQDAQTLMVLQIGRLDRFSRAVEITG